MTQATQPVGQFVMASPARTIYYNAYAQTLERLKHLRYYALGTRRGIPEVPPEHTCLFPWIGLKSFVAAKILPPFAAESYRFRLLPQFDAWVKQRLVPGDHILSSYGYTNDCFKFVRAHGGKTFVDAGNSHIDQYWEIISEEHRRWNCPTPPFSPFWRERAQEMLTEHTDYVLSPSRYVTDSFLARGFKPEQILKVTYPVNLDLFFPDDAPRPKDRPLTLINTGSLSLRKGTPYLLEAFRLIQQKHRTARLLLTQIVQDDIKPVLARYRDLPIEWAPPLPHAQLAERLRNADIFVLPSLEEGLVRTACEAMACGLPAILTPHTGANDFIQPGVNGEVVPIRDPQAIADAVLKWADIVMASGWQPRAAFDTSPLTFDYFEKTFLSHLTRLNLIQTRHA